MTYRETALESFFFAVNLPTCMTANRDTVYVISTPIEIRPTDVQV